MGLWGSTHHYRKAKNFETKCVSSRLYIFSFRSGISSQRATPTEQHTICINSKNSYTPLSLVILNYTHILTVACAFSAAFYLM